MTINPIKLFVEGDGEELFFKELKNKNIIGKNILIQSFGGGNKALKQDGSLNDKYLNKRILNAKVDGYKVLIFLFDIEQCDLEKVNKNIEDFSKNDLGIGIHFFLEVKQFESWLLSDNEAIIKAIQVPKKDIKNLKIKIPTDNIKNPEQVIKNLYDKYNKKYKKNCSEKTIASHFCLNRGSNNSLSLQKFYNFLNTL